MKNNRMRIGALLMAVMMVLMLCFSLSATADDGAATDSFMERISQYRAIVRQRKVEDGIAEKTDVLISWGWFYEMRGGMMARLGRYADTPESEAFDFTYIQGYGALLGENTVIETPALVLPSYTMDVFLDGGIKSLTSQVLANFTQLQNIFIPDTVTDIAEDVFAENVAPVIYGFDSSTAQTFAQAKGWRFVAVPDIPGDTNMDLTVDMKDVYLLRCGIASGLWDSSEWMRPAAGDLDGDTFCGMKDVLILRRRICGLSDDGTPA